RVIDSEINREFERNANTKRAIMRATLQAEVLMSRPHFSIATGLAVMAVVFLSASQDPPPAGTVPQRGDAPGRRGGPAPGGAPVGGTLTPKKPDERGWGWQVKALMNPATPRPLYNRAKEALFNDRQITSYTFSSF